MRRIQWQTQNKQLVHSFSLQLREWNHMVEKVVLCVEHTLQKTFVINAASSNNWFTVLKVFGGIFQNFIQGFYLNCVITD